MQEYCSPVKCLSNDLCLACGHPRSFCLDVRELKALQFHLEDVKEKIVKTQNEMMSQPTPHPYNSIITYLLKIKNVVTLRIDEKAMKKVSDITQQIDTCVHQINQQLSRNPQVSGLVCLWIAKGWSDQKVVPLKRSRTSDERPGERRQVAQQKQKKDQVMKIGHSPSRQNHQNLHQHEPSNQIRVSKIFHTSEKKFDQPSQFLQSEAFSNQKIGAQTISKVKAPLSLLCSLNYTQSVKANL